MLIYCHGLGSSGQSEKATILKQTCGDLEVVAPNLPLEPRQAIRRIEEEVKRLPFEPCLLIGSSLGGFYALNLHQKCGLPAVLLNPATNPFQEKDNSAAIKQHLDYPISWQEEYSTQLFQMQIPPEEVNPHNLWIYLAKDDELLSYRRAEAYFAVNNCALTVLSSGGHRLDNFAELIPDIRRIYAELSGGGNK